MKKNKNQDKQVILNEKRNFVLLFLLYTIFAGFISLASLYIIRDRMTGADKFFIFAFYALIFIVIAVFVESFKKKYEE